MKQTTQTLSRIVLVFSIVLLGLIPATGAQQREPVGKVVAVRGDVTAITPQLQSNALTLASPVYLHDVIKTRQGRVQMIFKDKTIVTLGRDSEMKITEYVWEPGKTDASMKTEIREGSFRIMGGGIARIAPDKFNTDTPSGTIGIRGSMYAGSVKASSLSVIFQGGKGIYVKNEAGMVDITHPGFGTRITSPTQAPEKPRKVTPRELLEFENAFTPIAGEETETEAETSGTTEDSQSEPAPVTEEPDPQDETLSPSASSPSEPDATTADSETDTTVTAMPAAVDNVSEISTIVDDTVVTAAQDTVIEDSVSTGSTSTTTVLTPTQETIVSMLATLGVTGTESTAIPSTGLWIYVGEMQNTITNDPAETIKFVVNWDNGRILGIGDATLSTIGASGFGFGTITSTGDIANINVLGSGGSPDTYIITALTGYETFGHFYGTGQEGLGLAMEGYDVNVQNQSDMTFWSDIAAASVETKIANTASGTETWKGFFTGIGEDMSNPNANRRIFYNTSADDFAITINKDDGTYSGSMSGNDFDNPDNFIQGLTIGGGIDNSVYISDKLIAAALSGNNVITIGALSGGLKSYGNFMVSSRKTPLSSYTSWGYWEVAYAEPGTNKDYHIHVPGAMWIAGNQTPSAAVGDLISASFTGTYTGGAEGVMFDDSSEMTEMTNGIANLTIDFHSGATTPVSGNISFDQIDLPVSSTAGAVDTSGFHAGIPTAAASDINGTFYGPNAEGIGGNFSAEMSDGMHYHGIFGGDR